MLAGFKVPCERLLLLIVFPCPGKKAYSLGGSIMVFPQKQAYSIKESSLILLFKKKPFASQYDIFQGSSYDVVEGGGEMTDDSQVVYYCLLKERISSS